MPLDVSTPIADGDLRFEIAAGAYQIKLENRVRKSRPWFIPPDELCVIDGNVYFRATKRSNFIVSLVCLACRTDQRSRAYAILKKVDIFKQLLKAKRGVFREQAIGAIQAAAADRKARCHRAKGIVKNLLLMPEIIEINAPAVFEVPGMVVNVRATKSSGNRDFLWMELTPANLTYLSRAVRTQWLHSEDEGDAHLDNIDGDDESLHDEELDDGDQLEDNDASVGITSDDNGRTSDVGDELQTSDSNSMRDADTHSASSSSSSTGGRSILTMLMSARAPLGGFEQWPVTRG